MERFMFKMGLAAVLRFFIMQIRCFEKQVHFWLFLDVSIAGLSQCKLTAVVKLSVASTGRILCNLLRLGLAFLPLLSPTSFVMSYYLWNWLVSYWKINNDFPFVSEYIYTYLFALVTYIMYNDEQDMNLENRLTMFSSGGSIKLLGRRKLMPMLPW